MMGIRAHAYHQLFALAGRRGVADCLAHGPLSAPDERTPGEVTTTAFEGRGRGAEAR